MVETLEFQAEAQQLLDLMVHSVYSEKDVFLRELISNASDALDKLRLEALLNKQVEIDTSDLHIRLEVDKQARTLSVIDNGVGMTRDEVVNLIGTIAKSGTREFLKMLEQSKDKTLSAEMIGQFGVGFYSCFMVADRVELITRKPGEAKGVHWSSAGGGSYTLEEADRQDHGTTVTLHLKAADSEDGLHDYIQDWKLRELVKRYSDFIAYPVRMEVSREDATELETLNSMKAIWARPKDEVTDEEYAQFYKHVSHDWNEPWKTIHMKGEGTFEYDALLFIPDKAGFDLFMPDYQQGLQLYVKRVFIMDHCEELVPTYLRFVRGVVDARDLSLNVSREILQKDRRIRQIAKRLTRKVLDTLDEARTGDADGYAGFWQEFGRVLKEGIYQDQKNRERLLELALFRSTHSDELTNLADYVDRMQEGQEAIYYLTGETRQAVEGSPHLEAFRQKGVEVLILTDSVDEIWLGAMPEFQGKKFQSAAKGELAIGSEEERKSAREQREQRQKEMATFLSWMQTKLEKKVREVRLSERLTTSPACLVGEANDLSAHLERLLKASGQEVPHTPRILELNPEHPLVKKLEQAYEEKKDQPELAETAEVLYGLALLSEGGELEEPADFSRRVAELVARSF